jgi:hypothetical protein
MEEISDEQQAAMALKLMDNVKQMIKDTTAELFEEQYGKFVAHVEQVMYRAFDDENEVYLVLEKTLAKSLGSNYGPLQKEVQKLINANLLEPAALFDTRVRQIVRTQMDKD